MKKEEALVRADDLIRLIIQHQPQFIIPKFADNNNAASNLANQLLELRKQLADGFVAQA